MVSSPHLMTIPGNGVIFLPRPVGGANPIWTVRGKYTNAQCLTWYQPKAGDGWNPTTIAESYVNRANPGTYDATLGTAPGWAALTGWAFTAALLTYLKTGLVPAADQSYSMVLRLSSYTFGNNLVLAGVSDVPALASYFMVRFKVSGTNRWSFANGQILNGSTVVAGANTLAVAGNTGYWNGAPDVGPLGAWTVPSLNDIYIGAQNANGAGAALYTTSIMTAGGIYNVPLDAADNADLHADLVAGGF